MWVFFLQDNNQDCKGPKSYMLHLRSTLTPKQLLPLRKLSRDSFYAPPEPDGTVFEWQWWSVELCKIQIVHQGSVIIIIIRQPLCPVVGRRPQHAVSKLPCLVLSSAISCRSSICPGRLSIAWLVSLVVFSCHMVSNW